MNRLTASPEFITRQREQRWPAVHPEDYCHKCGTENMMWAAERADWETATKDWAAETGREGICCPQCFTEMHADATDTEPVWMIITADRYNELIGATE